MNITLESVAPLRPRVYVEWSKRYAGKPREGTAMTVESKEAMDQWHRIESLVQHWLEERRRLLYMLCAVRGINGLTFDGVPVHHRVQQFCQVLMDYTSAGHFEVYRELVHEARSLNSENTEQVGVILQQLEDSTDEALAFNEDFASPESCDALLDSLPRRLSNLLEKLEDRFALEDQLIVSIHQRGLSPGMRMH
jgi:regulator of sigma D